MEHFGLESTLTQHQCEDVHFFAKMETQNFTKLCKGRIMKGFGDKRGLARWSGSNGGKESGQDFENLPTDYVMDASYLFE